MRFENLDVLIKSYKQQYLEDMRLEFNQFNLLDHIESFSIEKNYDQIIRASLLIS